MEEVAYDLCIVDEASKATATEILIRLSRSKRSIIVGDPEQLPPFFEQFGEDILKEFEAEEVQATLLDRLLNEEAGLPAGCRAGLKKQYRMIEPIGDLVSTCFYRGKLKSPVKSHGVKLSAAFPKPVTWYSTQDLPGRFEEPEGLTFRNPTEVAQIRTILMRLQFVAKAQKERISVAVLSGYTAQVRLLGEMIQRGVAEWPSLVERQSHSEGDWGDDLVTIDRRLDRGARLRASIDAVRLSLLARARASRRLIEMGLKAKK